MKVKNEEKDVDSKVSNELPTVPKTKGGKNTDLDNWIQQQANATDVVRSKDDASQVLDYIINELNKLDLYKNNTGSCKLKLRRAVHYLNCGGYEARGYGSLKACFEAEFDEIKKSAYSTLYREAEAARLEKLLIPNLSIGTVRESVFRPFGRLKKDENKTVEAWGKAMAAKSPESNYPTAECVKTAVNDVLKIEPNNEIKLSWEKDSAEKIAIPLAATLAKKMAKFDRKQTLNHINDVMSALKKHLIEELQE